VVKPGYAHDRKPWEGDEKEISQNQGRSGILSHMNKPDYFMAEM
jgi:hypothetical protein